MSDLSILHIVHDHPAFSSGGTEWVAHDLSLSQASLGATTALLAATTALSRPDARPGSLERLGEDWLLRTGAYDAFSMTRQDGTAWLQQLGRVLAETQPDIVHLHGLDRIGAEIVPAIRAARPSTRIVLTLHDFQPICANDGLMITTDGALCRAATPDACRRCLPQIPAARHALRTAHLRAVLNCVDLFIAPSAFLRQRFADWGLPVDRIALIPNAVPTCGDPAPLRGNRFAFFGNLAKHKGVGTLLDAAARLACREVDATLRIHGGFAWAAESERREFAAAVERAAPVVQHFGPYHRADLADHLAQSDWVVVPSLWWENAPLVTLEAQAAGRPVICTGIGGMAELVEDGVTGLHVPMADAAALADVMQAAAADPELCNRLAANIRPAAGLGAFAAVHLTEYHALLQEVPA